MVLIEIYCPHLLPGTLDFRLAHVSMTRKAEKSRTLIRFWQNAKTTDLQGGTLKVYGELCTKK